MHMNDSVQKTSCIYLKILSSMLTDFEVHLDLMSMQILTWDG